MALRIISPNTPRQGVETPLHFEWILDFPILHPTISLGILASSDGDKVEEIERDSSGMDITGGTGPTGPSGEMPMALVAYVIHFGGVNQVLIGKQDLESASQTARHAEPSTSTPPTRIHTQTPLSPTLPTHRCRSIPVAQANS
jgi:hypothetical protein